MPQCIGHYEIVRELGRGAMGVVFLGFDPRIARPVAIKTILIPRDGEGAAEAHQQALIREARAAGNLTHPAIVTMFQMGEEEGMLYLVMEYLTGGSLDGCLQPGVPADPRWSLRILAQIAEALDFAHRAGFVHRDIKPANILLVKEGGDRAKVADFGLARRIDPTQPVYRIAGTPSYMSPEQINAGILDGRSDQFALAQMAFQMLTGRVAFAADSVNAILSRILSDPPPVAHDINPQLHPQVHLVLARGLAKQREDRYPSCLDFVADLKAALRGGLAPPPQPPTPKGAWVPVAAAIATTVTVAAIVYFAEVLSRPAPLPMQPPDAAAAAAGVAKRRGPAPLPRVSLPPPAASLRAAPTPQPSPVEPEAAANPELTARLASALRNRHPAAAIQDLLNRGASAKGNGRQFPLIDAAQTCNEDAIRLLIARGADANAVDESRRTPLGEAYHYTNNDPNRCPNRLNVVRLLLDAGAAPNGPRLTSANPPAQAAHLGAGELPVLKLLLERGADPTLALASAARSGRLPDGACPLDTLQLLLALGAKADTSMRNWEYAGQPALIGAATAPCPDRVRLLLAKGANPNAVDNEGRTALHHLLVPFANYQPAVLLEQTKALLASGADLHLMSKPNSGEPATPLSLGLRQPRVPGLTALLLDKAGDPGKRDAEGRTLLHAAVNAANPEAVRLLLSRGAAVSPRDKGGLTPLGLLRNRQDSGAAEIRKLLLVANAIE